MIKFKLTIDINKKLKTIQKKKSINKIHFFQAQISRKKLLKIKIKLENKYFFV